MFDHEPTEADLSALVLEQALKGQWVGVRDAIRVMTRSELITVQWVAYNLLTECLNEQMRLVEA